MSDLPTVVDEQSDAPAPSPLLVFARELMEDWTCDQEAIAGEFGMGESREELPEVAERWREFAAITGDPLPDYVYEEPS